jgi:hypothetical protein
MHHEMTARPSAKAKYFFVDYHGGRTPTGWPHTAHSGKPDCRGPEAKPHPRDTPNTPIPSVLAAQVHPGATSSTLSGAVCSGVDVTGLITLLTAGLALHS